MKPHVTVSAFLIVIAGGAFLANGCATPFVEANCTSAMTLAVSSTTTPRFSWRPSDCRVFGLAVVHDSQGTMVYDWIVNSNTAAANTIRSPILYGTVPPHAFAGVAPPLRPGQLYTGQLLAEVWDEELAERTVATVAEQSFVP